MELLKNPQESAKIGKDSEEYSSTAPDWEAKETLQTSQKSNLIEPSRIRGNLAEYPTTHYFFKKNNKIR